MKYLESVKKMQLQPTSEEGDEATVEDHSEQGDLKESSDSDVQNDDHMPEDVDVNSPDKHGCEIATSSHGMRSHSGLDGSEGWESVLCIIILLRKRGNVDQYSEEVTDRIKCTMYNNWLHELCLPQGYCFTRDDDDFACPNCFTG